jgi:hypothetical protein
MTAKKKIILISITAVLCLAILAIILVVREDRKIYSRWKFKYFDSPAAREYRDARTMEDVNIEVVSDLFQIGSISEFPFPSEVELPVDLTYYQKEGNRYVEAYTIPTGTVVYAAEDYYKYGCSGFPTFDKEWSYLHPFRVEGNSMHAPYLYARVKDLKDVWQLIWETEPGRKAYYEEHYAPFRFSVENVAWRHVLFLDYLLYERGVYCSKNVDLFNKAFVPFSLRTD